jgi:hypothetical protein
MRLFLVLLAVPVVSSASPRRVDGIPVRGNTRSVTAADIRDAIRAVQDPVSSITVLNADRMRVYFKLTDLGWIGVRRDQFAKQRTDHTWPGWLCDGRGVDDPEVSQFMRSADELYVFPLLTPLKPHRDNTHLRRLDDEARRRLVRLLTDHRNYYQGGYTMIIVEPEPRNIGVLFRRGRSELVLFFSGSFTSSAGLIHGAFNGQHVQDMLEDNAGKKMEQWSHRFALPERPPPKRSNQAMERTARSPLKGEI